MTTELDRPSHVRHFVLGITALSAILLYLDRICISFAERYIKKDLAISDEQMSWILGSFFAAYALGQVPSGWLADRFGSRLMLATYITLWSLFTGLTGWTSGFLSLLICRMLFGLSEAGGYPTSAGLLVRWMPLSIRGWASSVVAFGGRIGGAIAPVLTGYLIGYGWRSVMQFYCLVGLMVAVLYWIITRDRPREHPRCNADEVRLIEHGNPTPPGAMGGQRSTLPWRSILSSRSLWLSSLSQFMTNVAWAFLITWLPRYLAEVHDVPAVARGWMAGAPIFVGWFGMLMGGWLTDRLVRVVGLRWGRGLPMSLSRFAAMGAYLLCLAYPTPWMVTLAFALVAFATDIGIGATWAFLQDVGGRHVGSVLGWTNMWGNFGAALSPWLLNWALEHFHDWNAAFLTCASAFFLSGLAALGVDATKRVDEFAEPRG